MARNDDYMFMMDFVNSAFESGSAIDSDKVAKSFSDYLKTLSSDDFVNKLICTGFIPDIYESDSSEETLFTKLVEVMTSEWARRMGFESEYVKQKASYQDVNIIISGKMIVCDSKSFRLGRSQAAPNVKDFLKLADITKWLERYPKEKRLGGFVVYPCKHEWTKGSDAYQYCSTKSVPTVMLPYKYLAYLLDYSDSYNTKNLAELWDYERIFPTSLKNKSTNKKEYWDKINEEIIRITNTSSEKLKSFMKKADSMITGCAQANVDYLEELIESITLEKKKQLDEMDKESLEEKLLALMIKEDTKSIKQSLTNINKFRF